MLCAKVTSTRNVSIHVTFRKDDQTREGFEKARGGGGRSQELASPVFSRVVSV